MLYRHFYNNQNNIYSYLFSQQFLQQDFDTERDKYGRIITERAKREQRERERENRDHDRDRGRDRDR